MSNSLAFRKSVRILLATLLAYGALVLTHEGEFWPFSIYPMFSRGGHPWSRVLVRELPDVPGANVWQAVAMDELPGAAFALEPAGISTNDLANFLTRTEIWNEDRVRDLEWIFRNEPHGDNLLILKVDGRIDETDTVRVAATPFALLTPGGTVLNPALNLQSGR
jgi:hypothetical protein